MIIKKKKKTLTVKQIYENIFRKMFDTGAGNQGTYYFFVMDKIGYQLEHTKNKDEFSSLLDYYISAIITETSASYATVTVKPEYNMLTQTERNNFNVPRNWFPTTYYTASKKESPIIGKETVNLNEVNLISLQVKPNSMAYFLNYFKKNNNCTFTDSTLYIPYLNLCVAGNDSHRIAAAKFAGNNTKLEVSTYDITALFEYVDTDGDYWIFQNSTDKEIVFDFRFAVIYSLAKKKYQFERHERI